MHGNKVKYCFFFKIIPQTPGVYIFSPKSILTGVTKDKLKCSLHIYRMDAVCDGIIRNKILRIYR